MNKTVLKDNLREIKNNLGRFMAILLLLLIAAVAFTGVYQGVLLLREEPEKYFRQSNFEDINVMSTYGLDEEDELVIASNPYVKDYEMVYYTDVLEKETTDIFRLEMLTDDISRPQLSQGRYPEKYTEIVLFEEASSSFDIGEEIVFVDEDLSEDIEGLHSNKFEIVGFVKSPQYLGKEVEKYSTIEGATLSSFGYILESAFDMDYYTSSLIKVNDTYSYYEEEYEDLVMTALNSLEDDFEDRPKEKFQKFNTEIDDLIAEAEEELNKAKADLQEAEDKLSDGEVQILEARKDLAQGKRDLLKARKELDQGWDQYYQGKRTYDREITKGQKQLRDGQAKLDNARIELDSARIQVNQGQQELELGKKQVQTYEDAFNSKLKESGIDNKLAQYEEGEKAYKEGFAKYKQGLKEYKAGLSSYQASVKELEKSKKDLDAAKSQLASLKNSDIDIGAIQGQIRDLQNLSADYEAMAKSKSREALSYQAQITSLSNENAGLESRLAELNSTLETSEDQVAIQDQINSIKSQISANKSKIEDLKSQASQAEKEASDYEALAKETNAQAQALASKTGGLGSGSVRDLESKIAQGEKEISQGQARLSNVKKELDASKVRLDESKAQLDSSRQELDQAKIQIDQGMSQVSESKEKLDQGKSEIARNEEKLNQAIEELKSGEASYNQGLKQLRQARARYSSEKSKGQARLDASLKKLRSGEAQYKSGTRDLQNGRVELDQAEREFTEAQEEYNEQKPEAYKAIREGQEDIDQAKEEQMELKTPEFMIESRNGDQRYFSLRDFPHGLMKLVYVFSLLALAVAVLVVVNNMTRMIDENRTLMGTYKGLGYSSPTIASKFIIFGGLSGIIGSIIGAIFGQKVLGPVIYDIYMGGFILAGAQGPIRPGMTIFSILVAFITTVIVALATSYRTLKQNTATLLRPKAPKGGNRILLENIDFIWDNLSFMNKITARNLFRYKGRMLMTILGVGVCMGLLVLGFSMKISMGGVVDTQYGDIIKYDLSVYYDEEISDKNLENITDLFEDEEIDYRLVSTDLLKLTIPDGNTQDVHLFIDDLYFQGFIEFIDLDGNSFGLDDQGLVISEKLAKIMDLDIGDTIELEIEKETYSFKISNIMKNYVNHRIYISKDYYNQVTGEKVENNALWALDSTNEIENALEDTEDVLTILNTDYIRKDTDEFIDSIDVVVLIIVVIAILLALVVQYSLTSINVAERIRELSTMKVLGFYPKEITMYVFKETIILSLMGIVFGVFIGKLIVDFILDTFAPSNLMFGDPVYPLSMTIAAVLTLIFTVLVMLIVHRKLKNVDMLDALSSVE